MARTVKRPESPESRIERAGRIQRRVTRQTDYLAQMRADGDA